MEKYAVFAVIEVERGTQRGAKKKKTSKMRLGITHSNWPPFGVHHVTCAAGMGNSAERFFFFFSPRLSSVASVFLWESLLPPCSVVPRLCVVRPVYFSTICFTWCGRRDNVASHATSAPDEGKYCLLPSFEQRAKRRELANLCVSTRRAAPCTASA